MKLTGYSFRQKEHVKGKQMKSMPKDTGNYKDNKNSSRKKEKKDVSENNKSKTVSE